MKRNFKDPYLISESSEKRSKLNFPYFSSHKLQDPHQSLNNNHSPRGTNGRHGFNNNAIPSNFNTYNKPNYLSFNQPRFPLFTPYFSNDFIDLECKNFGSNFKNKNPNEKNFAEDKFSRNNLDIKKNINFFAHKKIGNERPNFANLETKRTTTKDEANDSIDSVISIEHENVDSISINSDSSCVIISENTFGNIGDLYDEVCCDTTFIKKITDEITQYCCINAQTDESLSKKISIKNYLEKFLTNPLYIVGSTCNGLGLVNSDIDLCYRNYSTREHSKRDSKLSALHDLTYIKNKFNRDKNLCNIQLIHARVPILKFKDRKFQFECDLNINNVIGIRNSYLLRAYSSVDVRLKLLVLFVKYWARKHNINDASCGTLSSYSISLMAIHFLQHGCNPPVLPNLQVLYPEYFNSNRNVDSLPFDNFICEYTSTNKEPPGMIFIGFLRYYSRIFNFEKEVASIRLGSTLVKRRAIQPHTQWQYIGVEEPFDRSNAARAVYDVKKYEEILRVFRRSYQVLVSTKNIYSILKCFEDED